MVLTARTAALSFFQNPALDREFNPHAILIHVWFFSPLKQQKGCGLDSRIYGNRRLISDRVEILFLCHHIITGCRTRNATRHESTPQSAGTSCVVLGLTTKRKWWLILRICRFILGKCYPVPTKVDAWWDSNPVWTLDGNPVKILQWSFIVVTKSGNVLWKRHSRGYTGLFLRPWNILKILNK
jgi:hypothetical protein